MGARSQHRGMAAHRVERWSGRRAVGVRGQRCLLDLAGLLSSAADGPRRLGAEAVRARRHQREFRFDSPDDLWPDLGVLAVGGATPVFRKRKSGPGVRGR